VHGLTWDRNVPGRGTNNLFWPVARSHERVIRLMVAETTGFEQASDLLGALQSEPGPPPWNMMIEAYINRPVRWQDVGRGVLNWSDNPADEALSLNEAMRLAKELEGFATDKFDLKVVLHRVGDPPLDLFRFPKAFVTVPGSTDMPITPHVLLLG